MYARMLAGSGMARSFASQSRSAPALPAEYPRIGDGACGAAGMVLNKRAITLSASFFIIRLGMSAVGIWQLAAAIRFTEIVAAVGDGEFAVFRNTGLDPMAVRRRVDIGDHLLGCIV